MAISAADYVALVRLLEDAGLSLSERQLACLIPYLTSVRRLEAIHGQLRTKAKVFARRGAVVLAVDDTFAQLVVGECVARSPIRRVERYASAEMALRAFVSRKWLDMASNNRWRGP